ncbi:MAG: hypothetical protein IJD58_12375 [Lachnospiraceae bacterium]|nr:hypothetical protein [Lachnospiraceae bacterium]
MNDRATHYNEMDYDTFYNLVNDGDMIMWDNGDIDIICKDRFFTEDGWEDPIDAPGRIAFESSDGDDITMIPLDAKFEIYRGSFIHIVQWEHTSAFTLCKKANIFDPTKEVKD